MRSYHYPSATHHDDSMSCQLSPSRVSSLQRLFIGSFDHQPQVLVRAPGRINLIGEHIDYSGYSVLPMALQHDALIASSLVPSSPLSPTVRLINSNHDRFVALSIDHSDLFGSSSLAKSDRWANFATAAIRGLSYHIPTLASVVRDRTFHLAVDGRVPVGSGLSSSASMICGYTISVLRLLAELAPGESGGPPHEAQKQARQLIEDREALAALCADFERLAGVETGGMDQAICILAEAGSALHIHFVPKLHSQTISLPPIAAFFVANSLREHQLQSHTAGQGYNLRVVECRLAAAVLATILFKNSPSTTSIRTLRQLHDHFFLLTKQQTGVPDVDHGLWLDCLQELTILVSIHLQETPYDRAQVAKILCISLEDLHQNWIGDLVSLSPSFHLRQRALHVFSEASRVERFVAVCRAQRPTESVLQQLGELMNQSHESCRDLFDCSCPELEELVRIGRSAGATGIRLTGAGWGGCVIALVPLAQREQFQQTIQQQFFTTERLSRSFGSSIDLKELMPDLLFESCAVAGASSQLVNPASPVLDHHV